MTLTPTPEQNDARRLFATGNSMKIEAGAGTGKTSTLVLLAEDAARRGLRCQYVAFNKAIVTEAGAKFPGNTTCSTAHSLAFRAVGRNYAARLRGNRMKSMDIARMLRIDPFIIRYGSQSKPLAAGYLAGLVMRSIGRFCQTADPVPAAHHVPYIDGIDVPSPDGRRTYENNGQVRDHVMPYVTRAWADLCDRRGQLPYKHDHYLKQWQLAGPRIDADVIFFDECQPPSTVITMAGGGIKRLGDVKVGDRVVSYTKGRVMSRRFGSVVLGKTVRHHSGELINVSVGVLSSSYTPNHICMAKVGGAFDGKFLLYLMRHADGRFRIGVAKARHGTGPGRTVGVIGRLREEGGDAVWVLDAFSSRPEAETAEQLASLIWRIPQARFNAGKFWAAWDVAYGDPGGCAASFGRDLRYPFVGPKRRYMLGDRFTEIRACNLMDGMLLMDDAMVLRPATVWRTPYEGPVVSLAVSGPATYVADGLVTHNCQDANPVMAAIVAAQTHAQLVWVGDSQQQIYTFTGAVNALAGIDADHSTYLTQSFRFGPHIANVANGLLERLNAELRLVGSPGISSVVGPVPEPDVILTRTNAVAVQTMLEQMGQGRRPALVGGGREVIDFARAARDLKAGRWVSHPELACFQTWGEVQEYVENDPQGDELKLLVDLIDSFGVDTILQALEGGPQEADADVVISTAHKAKGREWGSVQLAGDFRAGKDGAEVSADELRLLYVACTRARFELDITACPQALEAPAETLPPLPPVLVD